MVDLSAYKKQIQQADVTASYDSTNPRELFLDTLFLAGFTPPSPLLDGVIDRIKGPGDKGTQKSGWYVYNQYDSFASAVYGSWKGSPEREVWTSKSKNSMSFAEKIQLDKQIKEADDRRKAEQLKKYNETAQSALEKWEKLPNADGDNPYLIKKKVTAFDGIKADGENLVVPVTLDGALTSLQTIRPDSSKKFMAGGRTKGCYYKLAADDSIVYVAEGYATAASIVEASGNSCYIAFSAHNLYEVVSQIKDKYQRLILCADNDDTCRNKAIQITNGLGVEAIYPPSEHNDFNDWAVADKAGVIEWFGKKPVAYKGKTQSVQHGFEPGGVLQKIIDYYNATSGNEQPLFAIQSAIAACSVMLGRNFTTNYSNKSSLFLMNIGKSGTGKEHAKKTVEKVLEATGNGHLVSGDGYTSASAVISALQERPRHITIIDEFSKYLQAAQNKNASGHLMEANAALMQAIGRLEGTMRARAYATIGLSQAKKKEMANQMVESPAITLLTMTTPDDLFNTIGVQSIKDGFINRFIICVSDAERTLRVHKEPIEVPESIIEWADAIRERRAEDVESSTLAPKLTQLDFTIEATNLQREFQQYCIDKANELEEFGMDEIPGRSGEMAMRLALIISLSQDPLAKQVGVEQMSQAINWVKFNLDRLIGYLKMSVSSSEHEASKKELLKALRKLGKEGISWSSMQKRAPFSKYKRIELKELLQSLLDAELIANVTVETEGAGRKPTIWMAVE